MTREQALKAHAERTRAEIDWANNPHEFEPQQINNGCWIIVNRLGEPVDPKPMQFYANWSAASDAISEMICDDEADRRLNRHRHERGADE